VLALRLAQGLLHAPASDMRIHRIGTGIGAMRLAHPPSLGDEEMSSRKQRGGAVAVLPCLVVVLATVVLSGCSHSDNCTNPAGPNCPGSPPPPPPASVKTVITEASVPSLPVDYVAGRYFSTSATGTIDVTVDWTFAEDTVHVWLAKGQCTFEEFEADTCQYATQSLVSRPKPRILSVPAATAGAYTLIIANWGPKDESLSYQIVLTSVSGASAAAVREELKGPAGFVHAWPRR
jgi:hypothetical protein